MFFLLALEQDRIQRCDTSGGGASMRRTLLLLMISADLMAQSISITSPAASQSIAGTSFPFTASITSLPSLYSVEYDVNGETACIVYQAPWSCFWNSYYSYGGPYTT